MRRLLFIPISVFFCIPVFAQIINGRDANIHDYYEQIQNKKEIKDIDVKKMPKPVSKPVSAYQKVDTSYSNNTDKVNVIEIGAGGLLTSLNFFKNAQKFTYYPAVSVRAYYQPKGYIRFMVDYSSLVQPANIIPTWLNVKSTYVDMDAHLLMHFYNSGNSNKSIVYFIMGVSAQSWKGYYTGIDDYNSSVLKIEANTNYKTVYFGGNVGFGFEYKFATRLGLYGEIRFRITDTDVGFGLSDVCYGVGLKCALIDFHPKAVYRKPGKHFKWF